jgi:uncharacterized protein YecT (DUF1311 family)
MLIQKRVTMQLNVIAILFAGSLAAGAVSAKPLCNDPKDDIEGAKCMAAEVDKADKKLAEYLKAAKGRLIKDDVQGINLDVAQADWLRYRTAQCGDVYTFWERGTFRHRAAAQCRIDLARARTHDLWSAYLTFVDSTPPLRPEP